MARNHAMQLGAANGRNHVCITTQVVKAKGGTSNMEHQHGTSEARLLMKQ